MSGCAGVKSPIYLHMGGDFLLGRSGRYIESAFGPLTPTVKLIIGVNIAVYLLLSVTTPALRGQITALLGLTPKLLISNIALWQPVTYMFLHQSFWHLVFNMLFLWWFGSSIEIVWGRGNFLRYYFFTGVGAALCHLALSWNSLVPVIGASGAVFGLILAYGLLFPNREILFMFVLPMKAKHFVLLIGVLEFLMAGAGSSGDAVARFAHLGGLLFGGLWFLYYRSGVDLSLFSAYRRWKRKRALKKFTVLPGEDMGAGWDDENAVDDDVPPTFH